MTTPSGISMPRASLRGDPFDVDDAELEFFELAAPLLVDVLVGEGSA